MMTQIKNKIAWWLISLFSVTAVLVQIMDLTDDQMNMYKALAGLICFAFGVLKCTNSLIRQSITYGILMSVFMLLEILFIGNAKAVNILWIWAYIGPAILLFEFGFPRKYSFLLFYLISTYFTFWAFTGRISVQEILTHGSINYISILSIFCMCLYYLSHRCEKAVTLPYIPVLLVMFLSIWTGSRASIICCGIVFLLLLRINYQLSNSSSSKSWFFVFAAIIIVGAIWFGERYIGMFDESLQYKMDKQGMDSARSILWGEYISGMFSNIGEFLFGVDGLSSKYPHLQYYNGNPHNSFLVLHAKYGIIGFIFIISRLYNSIVKSWKNRDSIMILLIVIAVVRCFFDWNAFPGLYDVLFWFIILYGSKTPQLSPQVKQSII